MTGITQEEIDNPLERLRLLSGDDDAIASFLDELEVSSPREREMLAELARRTPLARPDRFDADHRRVIEALASGDAAVAEERSEELLAAVQRFSRTR